jgi:purine-binding chemotaxis protein CheW
MKNTLVKSKFHAAKQANREAVTTVKVVVFKMGDVSLALHVHSVAKVTPQTTVYGSGLHGVGLAHLGDREVTVVDLYERLFQSSSFNNALNSRYLMIVKNRHGEFFGIPVSEVPSLMEIPLSCIRVLPESYRNADIFGFATHVAVIPATEPPMTIFMLDVEQLLVMRGADLI